MAHQTSVRASAVLLVVAGTLLIDSLVVALLGVALPSIGAEFGGNVAAQWALTAFPAGFAAALLGGGPVARRWGRRRAYLAALSGFAAAATAAALAPALWALVAATFVMGVCAGITAPAGGAVIGATFEAGPAQRRAARVYATFGTAGATLGLVLSGVLAEWSWRLAVLAPAPAAVVLLGMGLRCLPDTPVPPARPVPLPSALVRAALGAASLNGASVALVVVANFLLQQQFGWAPWQSALLCVPAFVTLALSVVLAERFGTTRPIRAGAVLAVAGCALPALSPTPVALLGATVLLGAAYLLSFAPLNVAATASVAPPDRPAAGLAVQLLVQLGAVATVPLATALLLAGPHPAVLFTTAVAVVGLGASLSTPNHAEEQR
ncbi:MFS transporter [Lentzea sp. NBRC 102530]|uniref:MFS transporter n=1 Tax=Lentzea sp. NBRC 102530 TaxID=3032201 RepID=UPI0024A44DAC|nr:MFS transporter [Lentzea sp. NBRC 102530]GLY46860.1 hypothetical protein Lesp01_05160 [Lentzea sp. NBRC 102530]